MICKKCGYDNRDGATFCNNCGAPLNKENKMPIICPFCGTSNSTDNNFCLSCGKPLSRVEANQIIIKKKKRTSIIIIAVCAILLIAGGVGGYYFISKTNSTKKYKALINEAADYCETLDYEEAIDKYLKAIEIEPKKAEPYLKLADIYVAQEKYDEALDILKKAKKAIGNSNKEINAKYEEVEHLSGLELSGMIKDGNGNPIDGAKINVIDKNDMVVATTTSKNGEYSITLPKGSYVVSVTIDDLNYSELNIDLDDDQSDCDFTIQTTLTESEMKDLVASKGTYVVSWQYYDYDFDGDYEAFAVVTDSIVDTWYTPRVYYISSTGEITNLDCEAYSFYDDTDQVVSDGNTAFFTFDYGAGGSGWLCEIYSVRNQKPYRLDSTGFQGFMYLDDYSSYCTTVSDFSAGYHAYAVYTLIYNSSTGEFSLGNKVKDDLYS